MSKVVCDKCGGEFSTRAGNYKRHYDVCDGIEKGVCRFCGIKYQNGSHVKWCELNPDRSSNLQKLAEARTYSTSDESLLKRSASLKKAYADGKYDSVVRKKACYSHSDETRKLISEKARLSKHRRVLRKTVSYNGVILDSSWELAFAKRLDFLGIVWIRPEPVEWVDKEGLVRNYFPDFYLPEQALYVEIKNKYLISQQRDKLNAVFLKYNIILLDSLEQCETYSAECSGTSLLS